MKAAVIKEHGGLDKVEIAELPEVKAGFGQVVMRVKAAALNHLDIWVRQSERFELEAPHILGSDAAGEVLELGEGVEGIRVGDEVVLDPGTSCGRCDACVRGAKSLCTDYGLIGATSAGTYAQQIAVPAANVHPKPESLDWVHAAALPLAHLTAWRMLITRARLRPGETVLVHGIGGGVALAGLQIAKRVGARAIVTSSSSDKLERAARLGAEEGINYREAQVGPAVRELTDGVGVDVILDSVGAATWETNFRAIRKGGRIVHCGVTTGAKVEASIQDLYWNQVSVLGSTMGGAGEMRDLLRAVEAAGIEPVVDTVMPLDEARAATQRMEEGEQFGKIVLEITE